MRQLTVLWQGWQNSFQQPKKEEKTYAPEDLSEVASHCWEQDQLVACLVQQNPRLDINAALAEDNDNIPLSRAISLQNFYGAALLLEAGADPFALQGPENRRDTPMHEALGSFHCVPMEAVLLLYYDPGNKIKQKDAQYDPPYQLVQDFPDEKSIIDSLVACYDRLHAERQRGDQCLNRAHFLLQQGDISAANTHYSQAADAFLNAATMMLEAIPKVITEQIECIYLLKKTRHSREWQIEAKQALKPWSTHITITLLEQALSAFQCIKREVLAAEDKAADAQTIGQWQQTWEYYQSCRPTLQSVEYQQYQAQLRAIKAAALAAAPVPVRSPTTPTLFSPPPQSKPIEIVMQPPGKRTAPSFSEEGLRQRTTILKGPMASH